MKAGSFRNRVKVPREERLSIFLDAIDKVFNKNISTLSFEQLHRNCYELIIDNQGPFFLEGVLEKFRFYARRARSNLVACGGQTNLFLELFIKEWQDYKFVFIETSKVAMYADKNFIEKGQKTSLRILCTHIFRDLVILDSNLASHMRELLLKKINLARVGEEIDRPLLKSIVRMIGDCCVSPNDLSEIYGKVFESYYLADLQSYFENKSLLVLSQSPGDLCLRKIHEMIEFETQLCVDSMLSSTLLQFSTLVNKILIDEYVSNVISMQGSGCHAMIVNDQIQDLDRMRKLSSRTPHCYDLLRNALKDSVVTLGSALVDELNASKDSVSFVNASLSLQKKIDDILNIALENDRKAVNLVIKGFQLFMNKSSLTPNALAVFIDHTIKSKKENEDSSVEDTLDKTLTLVSHVQDKDIFEFCHRRCLTRRSIYGKSTYEELEKFIILRLKKDCGFQFTTKLDGMLGDLKLSHDLQNEFEGSSEYHLFPFKLVTKTLSTGFWPLNEFPVCAYPKPFQETIDLFRAYYLNKHSGRLLKWMFESGTVELKASFSKTNVYMLELSFYQACILMFLDKSSSSSSSSSSSATSCSPPPSCFSVQNIEAQTGIPKSEFKRHFYSLVTPKCPLLKIWTSSSSSSSASSASSSSANGDTTSSASSSELYCLNRDFVSKRRMMSVPLLESKKSDNGSADKGGGGSSNLDASSLNERTLLIDSAIVRIMKSRKTLQYMDIFAEAAKQVSSRFVLDSQVFKRRIENLIERDYISRDERDERLFHYIA